MKPKTVHELRKNGWKVKVGHHRLIYRFCSKTGHKSKKIALMKDWVENNQDYYLSPKGGLTTVHLTSADGNTNIHTSSRCLEEDYYNNKVGLKIAIGRAISKIEYNVSE